MEIPQKGQCLTTKEGKQYYFLAEASVKEGIYRVFRILKAWDEREKRFCFIKFTEKKADNPYVNNMMREGGFRFCHPFIARVLDCFEGEWEGVPVVGVCQEYIEGKKLEDYAVIQQCRMRSGELSEEQLERESFRQIMEFLEGMNYYTGFSSRDPFLHRDIKPANIMITSEGHVKIIDFDFAHLSESRKTMYIDNCGLGNSHGYTSPEMVNYGKYSIQTDIFSTGKVIFYWLHGISYCRQEECTLSYGLDRQRFAVRYRQQKYRKLLDILEKMSERPEKSYDCINQVIEDMRNFLVDFCGGSWKSYAEYIELEEMPVLKRNLREDGFRRNVFCKIYGQPGRYGHPLTNHNMRDITQDGKLLMTICNLDGEISYIPYAPGLKRQRDGDDYQVISGDKFMADNGTVIQIWLN